MAFMFYRRLAIPLWAIAFVAVALAAPPPATLLLMPPTTLLVIALAGMAVLVFAMPSAFPWLRTSRSLAPVRRSRHRDRPAAAIAMAAGVRRLDEPNRRTADDALDSARMDDDGGGQMGATGCVVTRLESNS